MPGAEQTTTRIAGGYGKQECFWAQLEGRLIELLRGVPNLSLSFVNQAAQAWVEQDYHRKRRQTLLGSNLAKG